MLVLVVISEQRINVVRATPHHAMGGVFWGRDIALKGRFGGVGTNHVGHIVH